MARTTKKGKKKTSPVSRPLSPTRLTELKALGEFPGVRESFDSQDAFKHEYDLWITYGHFPHRGNRVVGGLKLSKAKPDGGKFKFGVVQTYKNSQSVVHTLTASATCSHDQFALPRQWRLRSKFDQTRDTWQGIEKELRSKYEIDATTLRVVTNGKTSVRKLNGPTTSDWSLFEAAQRFPFKAGFEVNFDLLEGLSVLRPAQRITYEGHVTHRWGSGKVQLHYYRQFGQGMLPYEYYLDKTHRLVMVVSGYRAYILKGGKA